MLMLKLSIAIWMLFTAVWMFAQDSRIERLEKKLMEGGAQLVKATEKRRSSRTGENTAVWEAGSHGES